MFAADPSTRSSSHAPRPATDDVRRALIMDQRLRAAGTEPPSRLATAARTTLAVLALGAVVAILAVVGVALFLFTLGIAVAATAALLVVALVDRLRGRPTRRVMMPAAIIVRRR
ncbi:MAG: hypothetical protein AAGC46_12975 [Solirubrobacteraceae bacterium]|nr:hypothetical protein [Patulibacter sp.]